MASVVVPDLHGCAHHLRWVLQRFPGRSLILLGDLTNRGPETRGTLHLALALARERRATLLWGNHEYAAWEATAKQRPPAQARWLRGAGHNLLQAYGGDSAAVMRDLTDFALLARHYHVENDMLCAHAARPHLGRSDRDLLDLNHLWDRPQNGLRPIPVADVFGAWSHRDALARRGFEWSGRGLP